MGHRLKHAPEDSRPAPPLGAGLESLHRDSRSDVRRLRHTIRRFGIDQGAIGINQEERIVVANTEIEQVLTLGTVREGFAAGDDKEAHTPQAFGFPNDAVEYVPLEPLAARSGVSIAALAVEVARLCRADDHEARAPLARVSPGKLFGSRPGKLVLQLGKIAGQRRSENAP